MGKSEFKGRPQSLTHHILEYLLDHPDAKDTVDGVMNWWVGQEGMSPQRQEVEAALQSLVTKGWVLERVPAKSLFGLNKERLEEIQRFLREQERP